MPTHKLSNYYLDGAAIQHRIYAREPQRPSLLGALFNLLIGLILKGLGFLFLSALALAAIYYCVMMGWIATIPFTK